VRQSTTNFKTKHLTDRVGLIKEILAAIDNSLPGARFQPKE